MTTPIDVLIQDALIAQLTTPALSGSPAIANPLVKFTPTSDTAYLDARPVLRAEPQNLSLDYAGTIFRRGIFQVDAVIPDGKGERPGLQLAALVAARFAMGTKLVAGSYLLKINQPPSIAAAVKDAPWVRFPVSIPFLVIT